MRPAYLLPVFVAAVAWLSGPPAPVVRGEHLAPLLPRSELLRVLGASHRQLVADYFWVQTIQAVGRAKTREEYRDIYYYANLTTDLDPGFLYVFTFAGPAIPYNLGRENWVNTEESTRILEKGFALFPNDLKLNILLAYNLSYFHREYVRAAALLQQASRLPGAPPYLLPLATRLYAQSGSFDTALALAESLREQAADEEARAFFERRVNEIRLERTLTEVEAAWKAFFDAHGRPATVAELVVSGFLKGWPVDPFGGEIRIDDSGKAQSTSQQRRLRVFDPLNDEP